MGLGAGKKGLFSSTLSLPSLGKSNRWQAEALGAIVRGAWEGRRAQCVSGRRWMPSLPCESWETAARGWVVGGRGPQGGGLGVLRPGPHSSWEGGPRGILRDPLKKT